MNEPADDNFDDLLPCPFCAGGETRIDHATHWTGMSSVPLSTRIMHWCPRKDGQPQSFLQVAGKTDSDAISAWNARAYSQIGNKMETTGTKKAATSQ